MIDDVSAPLAIGPEIPDALGTLHRPFRFFSADGVALAGRDYRPEGSEGRRPIVCLPGLTRSAKDFEPIVARLVAAAPARRVITFDFRGRGASQWADPATYTPLQELDDCRRGLAALGIERITAFGTSRGGIVTMLSALVAPGLVEAAILNDIGPVVELAGLLRIKRYVGRTLPADATWEGVVLAMRHVDGGFFPALDLAGFGRYARRIFRDECGRPVLDYDPALAVTMAGVEAGTALPELWGPFEALASAPVLVVHGARSDILSAATAEEMRARHPACRVLTLADEGHAPLFDDTASQDAVIGWLDDVGA